jgi:voltage-gated potassium channel
MSAVPSRDPGVTRVEKFFREFFYGTSEFGMRAQYLMLALDVVIVLYFVVSTFWGYNKDIILFTDRVIGLILIIELSGRLIADEDRIGFLSKPLTLLDIAIIISLFLPEQLGNFMFLRVVRALRIFRSYYVTRRLRQHFKFFARNDEIIFSTLNLLVFIFVVTAFVFVWQQEVNDSINNYIDALYFTITTLTTTGFGDVTLVGAEGRLLAILIMVVGVALFLRLVQTVFRPSKVRYECPRCGLTRHELDAVHCKHCGRELHIRTEGIG